MTALEDKTLFGEDPENKKGSSDESNDNEIEDLEWSPDQEILLLYSLIGLKPVGPHKHFRMVIIQDRLSKALNRNVPTSTIWKKLDSWYDLDALDEAEAEADVANSEEKDFELPPEEYGKMMRRKMNLLSTAGQELNDEPELEEDSDTDVQILSYTSSEDQIVSSDEESSEVSDSSKEVLSPIACENDTPKRGLKKTFTPAKDNVLPKTDSPKEIGKKDTPKKEECKKVQGKEEDKKCATAKAVVDLKKEEKKDDGNKMNKKEVTKAVVDLKKEEKKDDGNQINKKEVTSKTLLEQTKKEVEAKTTEQKKPLETLKNQRETNKQLSIEFSKRGGESKMTRSITPKHKTDSTKESNSEKKKEGAKKEWKSPEKSPEPARGSKLRARKETDSEKSETPSGTKRTKETMAKSTDESPTKKSKSVVKGRPTRNSMEPQTPTSPASSPQKRKTRLP